MHYITSAAGSAGATVTRRAHGRQNRRAPGSHEPTEHPKTPKKAAASGWIGSALEYYDFFIYAQAAALVFPDASSSRRTIPRSPSSPSFATFGVGYVARPIGAFVLGHWGDTHGRKTVLVLCMLLMGASDVLRRACCPPTTRSGYGLRSCW